MNVAIKPICNRCGKELDKLGGLLFSPPDNKNNVKKYHICKDCFGSLLKTFEKQ